MFDYKPYSLHVICGPMFAGKTSALISIIKKFEKTHRIAVFKHTLDKRFDAINLVTHDKVEAPAQPVLSTYEILRNRCLHNAQIVCIDETQFFDHTIVEVCFALMRQGIMVVCAGLDLNFRAEPFGSMDKLMCLAHSVTKLTSSCELCGEEARFSQRLTNDTPSCYYEATIMVAGSDRYQARCARCFEICTNSCCKESCL